MKNAIIATVVLFLLPCMPDGMVPSFLERQPFLNVLRPSHAEASRYDRNFLRYLMYKKYLGTGNISLSYATFDDERKVNGTTVNESDGYTFNQNYNLNFLSYVYHPKLLVYGLGVNYRPATYDGDWRDNEYTRYSANFDFFNLMPFHLGLRGTYTDGDDVDSYSAGLSMSYTRKRKKVNFRNMREWTQYINNQRQNLRNYNQKNNFNQNDNNFQNNTDYRNNNNDNFDENINVNRNNLNYDLMRAQVLRHGFFDRVLPLSYHVDYDRHYTETDAGDSKTTGNYGSARMIGDYQALSSRTSYILGYGYHDLKTEDPSIEKESDESTYSAQSHTYFNDKDELVMKAEYSEGDDYWRGDTEETDASMRYTGDFSDRRYKYFVDGDYEKDKYGDTVDYDIYVFSAGVNSSYSTGRFNTNYRFGTMYQNDSRASEDSYSLFAGGGAGINLTNKLRVDASTDLNWGKEIMNYGFRAGSSYAFSRRLQTYASYAFSSSSGDYGRDYGRAKTEHEYRLGVRGSAYYASYHSVVSYNLRDDYTTLGWASNVNTVLFRAVRTYAGLNLTRTKNNDTDAESSNMILTGGMTVSPWYRAAFRLHGSYTQDLEKDNTYAYALQPSLIWQIRKLFLNLGYKYSVNIIELGGDEVERVEQRFYAKLSRPFWF